MSFNINDSGILVKKIYFRLTNSLDIISNIFTYV